MEKKRKSKWAGYIGCLAYFTPDGMLQITHAQVIKLPERCSSEGMIVGTKHHYILWAGQDGMISQIRKKHVKHPTI